MSENPEDWRSAVDAGSGRTYWYHRKTRISTWIMPDFAVSETPDDPQMDSRSAKATVVSVEEKNEVKPLLNFSTAQPMSFKSVLIRVNSDPRSASTDDIKYLLDTVELAEACEEDDSDVIISALVNIVAQCSGVINAFSKAARHAALRCLFVLAAAQQRIFAGRCFHAHKAWTSLVECTGNWKANAGPTGTKNDPESALLLAALYSNLLVGPTYYMISLEAKATLLDLLDTMFTQTTEVVLDFDVLMGAPATVLSERTVQTFALLAEKGHRLPAVWLISVFTQAFRSEKLFVQLVQMGYLEALKSICISQKLDKDLKATAKECLLSAMASSAFVRDRVLEALLDLSADLSCVPVPMGPEPVLYVKANSAALDGISAEEDDEDNQLLSLSDDDGEGGAGQGERGEEAPKTVAQARYRHMLATGYCDVPVEGEGEESEEIPDENVWNTFQRDVEWIPKSGTPWRLSSTVLWARCPALRELISGFWDEGGGGLELSIGACDEVLAALCRYMHTGMLSLPLSTERQLELLRVASELGMQSLFEAASVALQQKLTLDSVHTVIAFCAENSFTELERACRSFLSSGGKRATVIRYTSAANELVPQNAFLRDAIFASLQDVNSVLNQPLPSTVGANSSTAVPSSKQSAQTVPPYLPPTQSRPQHLPNTVHLPADIDHREAQSCLDDLYGNTDYSENPLDPYPYEDASFSLMDLASAEGAGFSRGSSFREDFRDKNVMHTMNNLYGSETAAYEYTLDPHSSHVSQGGSSAAAGNNKSGKQPRGGSGGIYGLLLQSGAADGPAVSQHDTRCLAGGRPGQSSAAHPGAGKVPGRVMGDKRPSQGAPSSTQTPAAKGGKQGSTTGKAPLGQKAAPKTSAPHAGAGAVGAATEATPRTQRASSLLAAARPSAYAGGGGGGGGSNISYFESDNDQADYESDIDRHSWEGENSFFAEMEPGSAGPQEFSGRMSLAPTREKTVDEKRIERLTRPTKVLGVSKGGGSKADVSTDAEGDGPAEESTILTDHEGALENEHESAVVSRSSSRPTASTSPVAPASSAGVGSRLQAGQSVPSSGVSTAAAQQSRHAAGEGGLVSLKRSISPSTTAHSSREGHLVSIGSAPMQSGEQPMSPAPRTNSGDFNVRGSLTLLKTKAASSRRRRSVADIEAAGTTQAGTEREADSTTPTSTSASIDNPPSQNYKPSVGSRPPQPSVPVRSNAHVNVDLSSYLQPEVKRSSQVEGRHQHEEEQDYDGAGGEEEEEEQEKFQCPTCARSFYRAPLEKHAKICAKVFLQKRKTFDSAKMRIEGNPDLKEFIQETKGPVGRAKKGGKPALDRKTSGNIAPPAAPDAPPATPSWKAKSDAFRNAMQSSRAVSAAIATGAPLPPPVPSAPDPSLVPCPHCNRTFSSGAAERHIPKCTSIRAKPSVLKRGGGGNASKGPATPNGTSGRNNKTSSW